MSTYIRGYLDLDSDEQTKHFENVFHGNQPFTPEDYIKMNDSTDDMNVIFGKGDRAVGLRGTTASCTSSSITEPAGRSSKCQAFISPDGRTLV